VRAAPVDDAGLGGGAAHVERNGLLEPQRATQRAGADHASGGTRLEHAHALVLGLLRLVQPPGRLHEQELAAESRLRDVVVDAAHVLAHARADVGIRRDGRAALELAVFARELVRGGDERARQARLDDRLHARLVRGVDVTVEQHDRDRFHAEALEALAQRVHARLVERHQHVALGGDALTHLEP